MWHIRLAQDAARPLCLGLSLLLCPMLTQHPSVLLPLFVATLFLACLFFCFLLVSRLVLFMLAGRCSSCRYDQAVSTFSFSGWGRYVVVLLFDGVWYWRWSQASTFSVSSIGRCCGSWKVYWCLVVSCANTLSRRGAQRGHCSGRFWVWSFGSILSIARAAVDLQMLTWLFPIVLWCLLLHLLRDWWYCPGKWTCWRTRVDDRWSR